MLSVLTMLYHDNAALSRAVRWIRYYLRLLNVLLWPPCVADVDIIFLSCSLFFFFPCLISAVGDWMSTILPHMMWP